MCLPEFMNMTMLSIESTSWSNEFAIPYPTNFHPLTCRVATKNDASPGRLDCSSPLKLPSTESGILLTASGRFIHKAINFGRMHSSFLPSGFCLCSIYMVFSQELY
ncbi:hypothetical protein QYF36_014623 [Acer negundo]|nr:hypothetical protein QYF36_014623 [Acer negundo]